jgi:hypothetical protein
MRMVVILVYILAVILFGCGKSNDSAIPDKPKNTISEHEFVADKRLDVNRGHQLTHAAALCS